MHAVSRAQASSGRLNRPRFRELEIARVIVKTDRRREGCFVYVAAER